MKIEPQEEYSWVWNPDHGAWSIKGYMRHEAIFRYKPEFLLIYHDGSDIDYNAPRGTARIDNLNTEVVYTRYDFSRFGERGSYDSVDAGALHSHLVATYQIPNQFRAILWGEAWHNTKGFEFRK